VLGLRRTTSREVLADTGGNTSTMAVAMVWLAVGMLPYLLVGQFKIPQLHTGEVRHALLVPFPLALLLVATARLADRRGVGRALTEAGLVLLAAGFALSSIGDLISWQERWAKDRSVMENLARVPGAERAQIMWIDDKYPAGRDDFYEYYEWTAMLRVALGNGGRIGLDRHYSSHDVASLRAIEAERAFSGLAPIGSGGCEAMLTIERGRPYISSTNVFVRYLYYRLLRPEDLDEYLGRLTMLDLRFTGGACADGG